MADLLSSLSLSFPLCVGSVASWWEVCFEASAVLFAGAAPLASS